MKTNKNDAADAEAFCEAVAPPNMRFVPVKNVEQQGLLALHRARQSFVKARTAQANQLWGLLAEFRLIIPQGTTHIARTVPKLLEDATNEMPRAFRLLEHLKELDRQPDDVEAQIAAWHRDDPLSLQLAAVPGIGPITASALVAAVGDATNFSNGRQFAAWLGLVPRQNSSGGKNVLLGISKGGDTYLRTLLIHGARSVLYAAQPGTAPGISQRMSHDGVAAAAQTGLLEGRRTSQRRRHGAASSTAPLGEPAMELHLATAPAA